MRILADQNIPFAKQAFADIGEVSNFVGRELSAEDVRDVDILLVRSVSKVNAALLQGSQVKFVGSATIGTDHIDLDYLQQHNIGFANAPGSNATSAAEYVLTALLHVAVNKHLDLQALQVGIVGYGNVGSRVARLFRALGIQCHIYDPPRQQRLADIEYCDWQTICACDVISAHVPLTKEGDYPTYQMFNHEFFSCLQPGALFINTSRGDAVDEAALLTRLNSDHVLHLVLDVWQNEPSINPRLVEQSYISTPHIAGYAYDGKLRGTEMVYQAVCQRFDVVPQWNMQSVLTDGNTKLVVDEDPDFIAALYNLIRQAYTITEDSNKLRGILQMNNEQAALHFDSLRKNYPKRREFAHFEVDASGLAQTRQRIIQQLGFKLCP